MFADLDDSLDMTHYISLDHPMLSSANCEMLTHNPDEDLISRQLHNDKIWEIHETRLILDNLVEGDRFIDVGANIGYYTLLASIKTGNTGCVYAFEPDPLNFSLLEKNIKLNKRENVETFNVALTANEGDTRLYLCEDNKGDHRNYPSDDDRQSIQIKAATADRMLEHCAGINFIKIDTQGAETSVIKGFQKTLQANRSQLKMIIEFWPWGLRKNNSSCFELMGYLETLDLPMHIIDHVQGGIYSSSRNVIIDWMTETDNTPDNQGFINLFIGDVKT
ncbi:MAG: FkbM family methyltransferase [Pseudomonadales bacterium]|nr:FkbM family methyltransferase [Pseudomonadales bacterium]